MGRLDHLDVEVREKNGLLHGVILVEGRAASGGLAEVFAPGSLQWPSDGIAIRTVHRGPVETMAYPHRAENGEIRIRADATEGIKAALQSGKQSMSVEFRSLKERRTKGGVREILNAIVTAASLVTDPEYDVTRAEIREAKRRKLYRCL